MKRINCIAIGVLTGASLFFTGCLLEDKDKEISEAQIQEDKDTELSEAQIQESTTLADNGITTMGATFDKLADADFSYGKENWSGLEEANSEFNQALAINPDNSEAKFGRAITGMLLAVQSENVSNLLDEAETTSPLSVNMTENLPMQKIAILKKTAEEAQFPEFHEFQDAIADSVLPALDQAVTDLQSIYNDLNFSLTITVDGEAKELDRGEIGVMLAGFKALRALVTLPLSYDIDVDDLGSYDFIETIGGIGDIEDFSNLTTEQEAAINHIISLLTPGSLFLTARPDYQTRLSQVDDEMIAAVGLIKSVLTGLDAETDDQSDDILRMCSPTVLDECIEADERTEAIEALDSILKYISGPVEARIDELDTTIMVNPSVVLGQIQDFKKLIPYYKFYSSADWSAEKPVIYFTDAAGNMTGDLNDLEKIFTDADSLGTPIEDVVTQVRVIIKLQDPTFLGFLPNATEDSVWDLLIKLANSGDAEDTQPGISASVYGLMDPTFCFGILAQ